MKKAVIFFVFLLSFIVFAEDYKYGIVKDAKGYTEVKESGNAGAKVRAKLKNNTLVYIEETAGDWVKISTGTEYNENKNYVENVDGYIMKDKISYDFNSVIYMSSSAECDNVLLGKLVLKNKLDYADFSVLADYALKGTNGYEGPKNNGYSVKQDSADDYIYTLKINNGLELRLIDDFDTYISGLKYKKININGEKVPALSEFVPDTSVSGVSSMEISENKNYTIINIPLKTKGEGCSIEYGYKIFVFRDNNLSFIADMIYENITGIREFNKWVKVKEKE